MSSEERRGSKSAEMFNKMFHRKSNVNVVEVDDSASVSSHTPLVNQKAAPRLDSPKPKNNMVTALTQQPELVSKEEKEMHEDLMAKAKTMSPEEFKVYLHQHREELETLGRNSGAGITGLFWVYKDNTKMGPI
ncbi:hypothetical protein LTR10_015295 [Elasticomyces elasticus]|uniref:Uncharacterized protein n=1 Tax=Exophiala sideris TaxID=1016849 RepID=A0ABR0JJB4_9EURO|nr:hypothetical protein LTR10_015295 [Elasticomyces elasticus]KAK5030305.1 hypothetical protein LTR13_008324 [Exophiala sideris]KAK5035040.1 hypothetical protein LTS07_002475 [Exophiala sideris]KAK5065963.1 hypothetical protein LTR69_002480 [Exophiala sideris]KAK5178370.1 hypothetical protein LTR44_009246 [Eurotiomycetes sp. CCFEE 6388]